MSLFEASSSFRLGPVHWLNSCFFSVSVITLRAGRCLNRKKKPTKQNKKLHSIMKRQLFHKLARACILISPYYLYQGPVVSGQRDRRETQFVF